MVLICLHGRESPDLYYAASLSLSLVTVQRSFRAQRLYRTAEAPIPELSVSSKTENFKLLFFFFLNLQKPLFSHFGLFLALQERQTENRVRISKRNCVVTLCPDVSRSNKIQHHERGLLREKHCDCTVGIRRAEKLQKYKKARYVCYLLS